MRNQNELFGGEALEPLPLEDAELLFSSRIQLGVDRAPLLTRLIEETSWSEETIQLYGKQYLQPRLTAWYGAPEARYRYSGKTYEPLPFTPLLLQLKQVVEEVGASSYNSVLLNYYRDGTDSMGLHADDEPELGQEPIIASVSLGEQRSIYFQHRHRREVKNLNLPLPNGSLLLMRGTTQRNWKHGLRKLSRPCGPRINLTFRWIDPDYSRRA